MLGFSGDCSVHTRREAYPSSTENGNEMATEFLTEHVRPNWSRGDQRPSKRNESLLRSMCLERVVRQSPEGRKLDTPTGSHLL